MNSDDAQPEGQDQSDPSTPSEPEQPNLEIDPRVIAEAMQEGQAAEQTGNRLDAARSQILFQQVRTLQGALSTVAMAADNHHTQARNRQMGNMSSRDTAYYEGKGDQALLFMELLSALGVPIPTEGM